MSSVCASPTRHHCSCGRSFVNADGLQRHIWVTQHQALPTAGEAAASAKADSQDALAKALRALKKKQKVQQAFDEDRRARRRQLRRRLYWQQRFDHLQEKIQQGCQYVSDGIQNSVRQILQAFLWLGALSAFLVTGMALGCLL
jgi:hypothetical protein